jgi:heme-degrading monooxygenase HmoA
MITEIAQIDVKPGSEKDFEAAVAKARALFLRAKGGQGFELHKSISGVRRTSPHGADWSGNILQVPPRSNTPRRC